MGGMAGGAWLAARWSHRWRNPLLTYAIVEAAIGLAAVVFHRIFVAATDASYEHIIPALGSPAAAQTWKWLLSALLILPQSILLGAKCRPQESPDLRIILNDLREAWKGVTTVDFTIESMETEPQLLHILALNLLYPKLVGSRVHLNPLVVTVALMFWGFLWDAPGLVLAIPLTAGIKAVCDNVRTLRPYGKFLGD